MKTIKRLSILFFLALLVWTMLSYVGARYASHPNLVDLPDSNHFFDMEVEDVEIKTEDGVRIAGWYIKGDSDRAVVLANGIRGNRSGLVDRAKLYVEEGFGVLLIDLRGTGESDNQPVSYGWYERHDIHAATDFLRKKDYENIGAHGVSLGAAAIAYSLQEQPNYAFIILESCYGSVKEALYNRLKMKGVPRFTTVLMQYFNQQQLGVKSEQLQPTKYMSLAKMPVLIMAGDNERRVKKPETEAIYAKCGSTEKQLHYFKGAKHIDLLGFAPEEYRKVWRGFVNQ